MMVSTIHEPSGELRSGASFELFGSTLTARIAAADTGGAYSLVEYDAPPGQPGSPTHRHEQTEEYIFVLEGRLSIVVEGDERVAGPGEGVLIARGVEHSFANRSDEQVRFLTLLWPGGFESLLAKVAELTAIEGWEPTPEEFAQLIAPYDFVVTDHAH